MCIRERFLIYEGIRIYAKMNKWALELPFAETYQKIRYIAIELPTKSSHGNDLDFKIMTRPSESVSADNL